MKAALQRAAFFHGLVLGYVYGIVPLGDCFPHPGLISCHPICRLPGRAGGLCHRGVPASRGRTRTPPHDICSNV